MKKDQQLQNIPKEYFNLFTCRLAQINTLNGVIQKTEDKALKAKQLQTANKLTSSIYNAFGFICLSAGRYQEAINAYALSLDLDDAQDHIQSNLGVCFLRLGNFEKAKFFFEKAVKLNPINFQTYFNLGLIHIDEPAKALELYRRSLEISPVYMEAALCYGSTLVALEKYSDAAECFSKILCILPNNTDVINNIGLCYMKLEKTTEAIESFRKVIYLDPEYFQAYNNLGVAYETTETEETLQIAKDCYSRVIQLNPKYDKAYNNLANVHRWLGEFQKAEELLEKAIELSPDKPEFFKNLVENRKFTKEDKYVPMLKNLESKISTLPTDDKVFLHFALSRMYDDLKQHDIAFEHRIKGNKLKRSTMQYDQESTKAFFIRMKAIFTKEFIKPRTNIGESSNRPVFIVGMPRSGSTLIEQILSSHSQITGVGERKVFRDKLEELYKSTMCNVEDLNLKSLILHPGKIEQRWLDEDLRWLGASYIKEIRKFAENKQALRIVDKMLMNFRTLGFIYLALPNAKIIHSVRDPVDTCLSIYSKLFVDDLPYCYDLGELGRYYQMYRDIMQHWQEVIPKGVILDVQYENVVNDFEGETKKIMNHIGLEYEEGCKDFHLTKRIVRTASVSQVRQPIYKSSVGKYRPASQTLEPLLSGLGINNRAK